MLHSQTVVITKIGTFATEIKKASKAALFVGLSCLSFPLSANASYLSLGGFGVPIPRVRVGHTGGYYNNGNSDDGGSSGSSRSYSSRADVNNHNRAIKAYNAGVHLLNAKQAADAIPKFQEALSIDPGLPYIYGALGQALIQTGDYAGAKPMIEKATQVSSKDSNNWYELGYCAQHMHVYDESFSAYKHFLKMEGDGAMADAAKLNCTILEHTYASKPETIAADSSTNYLGKSPTDGASGRWGKDRMPIKVYITPGDGVSKYVPEFADILRSSFKSWQGVSGGRVSFEFVDTAPAADIVCSWTSNRADVDLGDGKELGITKLSFGLDGNIRQAEIRLLTLLDNSGTYSQKEIDARAKSVDQHEIGHALGLKHSPQPYDTMFACVPPSGLEFPLTMRDRNTLFALYDADAAAFARANIALNTGTIMEKAAKAPSVMNDSCAKLNDEASEANAHQQFSLAVEKLQAALSLDPENTVIKHNLGLACSNAAVDCNSKSDSAGAKRFYELSLKYLWDCNDRQTYDEILMDYRSMLSVASR